MPGKRLQLGVNDALPKYALIACYNRAGEDTFVQHVALLREKSQAAFGSEVPVWHAAPPIVAGKRTSGMVPKDFHSCRVNAVAYIDDLSVEETKALDTALFDIDAQTQQLPANCEDSCRQAQFAGFKHHYIADLPSKWVRDKKTGRRRYRKFSCTGFVTTCYSKAQIQLIDSNISSLPEAGLDLIVEGFGDIAGSPERRTQIGLSGDGPSAAVGGYLLHAMDRDPKIVRQSPYVPKGVEECKFPSRGMKHRPSPGATGHASALLPGPCITTSATTFPRDSASTSLGKGALETCVRYCVHQNRNANPLQPMPAAFRLVTRRTQPQFPAARSGPKSTGTPVAPGVSMAPRLRRTVHSRLRRLGTAWTPAPNATACCSPLAACVLALSERPGRRDHVGQRRATSSQAGFQPAVGVHPDLSGREHFEGLFEHDCIDSVVGTCGEWMS